MGIAAYYLIFSALEILARRHAGDYVSTIAPVLTCFLRNECKFDVVQNKPSVRERSIQTYTYLRNALFHNGEFEATFDENGRQVTLKLYGLCRQTGAAPTRCSSKDSRL